MSANCEAKASELIRIMNQEISLLEDFRAREEELKKLIRESDWENLEELMEGLERIAGWIEVSETKRRRAYAELCAASGAEDTIPFYQAIVGLPDETRTECAELYRSLKFTIVKIQGITWSLDSQIRSVSDTMQAVLNELFPYRKGKLYSRRGTAKTADTEPLVVNHHL